MSSRSHEILVRPSLEVACSGKNAIRGEGRYRGSTTLPAAGGLARRFSAQKTGLVEVDSVAFSRPDQRGADTGRVRTSTCWKNEPLHGTRGLSPPYHAAEAPEEQLRVKSGSRRTTPERRARHYTDGDIYAHFPASSRSGRAKHWPGQGFRSVGVREVAAIVRVMFGSQPPWFHHACHFSRRAMLAYLVKSASQCRYGLSRPVQLAPIAWSARNPTEQRRLAPAESGSAGCPTPGAASFVAGPFPTCTFTAAVVVGVVGPTVLIRRVPLVQIATRSWTESVGLRIRWLRKRRQCRGRCPGAGIIHHTEDSGRPRTPRGTAHRRTPRSRSAPRG